jgi:hypothetical protein
MGGSLREKIRKYTKKQVTSRLFRESDTLPPWYDHTITRCFLPDCQCLVSPSTRLTHPHSHSGVLFPVIIQVAGVVVVVVAVAVAAAAAAASAVAAAGLDTPIACAGVQNRKSSPWRALSIPFGRFGLNSD